jgi:S-DNA-T family DNA segregation ATPase FtsK/SpoIIIE
MIGSYLSYLLLFLTGWLSYFVPFGLASLALSMLSKDFAQKIHPRLFMLFFVGVAASIMINVQSLIDGTLVEHADAVGGYLGWALTRVSLTVLGESGTYIAFGGLILILATLYTFITPFLLGRLRKSEILSPLKSLYLVPWSWVKAFFSFRWLAAIFKRKEQSAEEETSAPATGVASRRKEKEPTAASASEHEQEDMFEESGPDKSGRRKTVLKKAAPVQIPSFNYTYPSLDLLDMNPDQGPSVSTDELNATSKALKETLETFGVSIEGPIDRYPGPVITRYEFKPGVGVKVNQIVNLADDLALALKAKRIRIIAPIPGKAAVGIEIPNRAPQQVYLREILASEEYADPKPRLPLALGKTTAGKPFVADLAKMPHLLIAGATGSGKSVCMNVLITSLIYRMHPMQIRFVFVDPKMLELSVYTGLPQLGRPVVTTPRQAEKVFADAVVEMENRYRRLASASVRNIEDFNRKQQKEEDKLPYIVLFVDELADLMMSSTSSKTEMLITRLAQMARAVGIHLILATQRPSVDVITGLIKANFPARIAFQVATKVDSRTIIDANGAEKLLGNGDMLFLSTGQPEPTRIHGAYISGTETDRIVSFIKEQNLPTLTLQGITQSTSESQESEVDLGDPLFREACEVVVRHKQGSVSLLQRRLGIGYQRAARLIDKLEEAGVVSPFDGSKAREVIVDKSYIDTVFGPAAGATKADAEKN